MRRCLSSPLCLYEEHSGVGSVWCSCPAAVKGTFVFWSWAVDVTWRKWNSPSCFSFLVVLLVESHLIMSHQKKKANNTGFFLSFFFSTESQTLSDYATLHLRNITLTNALVDYLNKQCKEWKIAQLYQLWNCIYKLSLIIFHLPLLESSHHLVLISFLLLRSLDSIPPPPVILLSSLCCLISDHNLLPLLSSFLPN